MCCLGLFRIGGRELIALGAEHGLALEVAYGDWQGFVDGVRALKRSYQKHPLEIQQASLNCSKEVRLRYSLDEFQSSVEAALLSLESRWSDWLR